MKTDKRLSVEPTAPHLRTGRYGEEQAVRYLRKAGYRILCRNWCEAGREELDIVAETRTVRIFAEVKTRRMTTESTGVYGSPAMAVTPIKQYHLLSAARLYNSIHPTKKPSRMDIVEVYLDPTVYPDCRLLSVRHMPDAFRA